MNHTEFLRQLLRAAVHQGLVRLPDAAIPPGQVDPWAAEDLFTLNAALGEYIQRVRIRMLTPPQREKEADHAD